jgi:hypothetical protein
MVRLYNQHDHKVPKPFRSFLSLFNQNKLQITYEQAFDRESHKEYLSSLPRTQVYPDLYDWWNFFQSPQQFLLPRYPNTCMR